MAQASSVQREPSMEEILASIRKIIEDSDSVRHPDADVELPEVVKSASALSSSADSIAQTHAELPSYVLKDDGIDSSSQVLTDLNTSGSDNFAHVEQSEEESHIEEVGLGQFENISEEKTILDINTDATERSESSSVVDALSIEEAIDSSVDFETLSSIVSESSAQRINAAFGELSQAYTASRQRSLDAMAKEMLQPMLKEWLDSNLPSLVEKLVREEIKRITSDFQN